MLNRCKQQPSGHKFRFKNPLYSLDVSVIDLSVKLFTWTASHKNKASVKLSVGLNHGKMLLEFVALSDSNENDMVQGRKFEFPKRAWLPLTKIISITNGFEALQVMGLDLLRAIKSSN